MKKSLLAVAVAAAIPAFAHAQTNVTLYGIGDISAGAYDRGSNASTTMGVFSGVASTSRWGIRGSEDLGGGLSAFFNFESEINTDTGWGSNTTNYNGGTQTGAGLDFRRRSVIGLASKSFGEIMFGRDYTPGFQIAGNWDIGSYGMWGSHLGFSTAAAGYGGRTVRWDNAAWWRSPSWGGFKIIAGYSAGENDSSTALANGGTAGRQKNTGNNYGLSLQYAGGPLFVGGYYQQGKTSALVGAPTPGNNKEYGIGAKYDFGMFRLVAGYEIGDPDGPTKNKLWNLGAGVKLGPGELMGQYSNYKYDGRTGSPKSDVWMLAYNYGMSKRTDLYASFGYAKNKNGAPTVLRSGGSQVTPVNYGALGLSSDSAKALSVGIRHRF